MGKTISTKLDASNLRFALVVSRFNEFITSRLLSGARDALLRHNATEDNLTEVWVPGSWELPMAAKALAQSGRYDALICLGCVIRGETTHHIHIGGEAAKGLARVSLDTNMPIGFGVLTTDTLEQAIERAGSKAGNKGADAAISAIEMAGLIRKINERE
ncbi:MAG: 6,7-dimethyl-8-ribityllumazine synthase [Phycisphaerales bacterium]|nr:6,7-dimethyl-8-ribityllumazine synthase [Phycisphaerales bacterium]